MPTAVIAARIDPQNAAKKPIEITMAIPNPPGQCPTKVVAKCTNRVAAPPRSIADPAKMKSGTAIRTCLVKAPKETCISTDQGKFNPTIAAKELPIPKTKKIGTEIHKRKSDNMKAKRYINFSLCLALVFQEKIGWSFQLKTVPE